MNAEVYILKSNSGKYYVGSTNNLDRRLNQHITGHTHSTKRMRNLKLVFHQEFTSLAEARRVEQKIKRWKRKDYIEKIILDGKIKISARSSAG